MFENETLLKDEKKTSNRHKIGKITCVKCNKEYIAEQRTLDRRLLQYGDNYCKECAPKRYTLNKKQLDHLRNLPHKKADPVKTYTITSGAELMGKRCIDNICYTCVECHTSVIRKCQSVKLTYKRYGKLLCGKCGMKNRTITAEDRKRASETRKRNNLIKYGVENISQVESVRQKKSETMKAKKVNWQQRQAKRQDTILKKYGSKEAFYKKSEEVREQHNMEKYGVKSTLSIPEVRKKIWMTSMEKYNTGIPSNNTESRKNSVRKYRNTCLAKYGLYNYMYSEEYRKTMHDQCRYSYGGYDFGSRWTLCFYIYYTELGKEVSFATTEYVYKNDRGKEDKYKPDFKMDGELYDIRGDEYYYGGKKYEAFCKSALYKFIEEKGIHIITLDEISMYYEYIEWRYGGLDWLKQYKVE